jgi:ribosomal protein L28
MKKTANGIRTVEKHGIAKIVADLRARGETL